MSHHNTVSHPQLDITDLYIFRKPDDAAKTILIMNVNPDAPRKASTFDPETSYEFKLDTNGDAEADLAFHVCFAPADHGQQSATVYRAVGADARGTGRVGVPIIQDAPVSFDSSVQITSGGGASGCRFYAGLRSDPWFVDIEGVVVHPFEWSGKDFFADLNVFAIVLEVPNSVFGMTTQISLWARTMAPGHHENAPVDQMGRPIAGAILLATEDDQHLLLHTPPSQQRAIFLPKVRARLQSLGYDEAEAAQVASQFFPDVQTYDFTRPTAYPNGRLLTDDLLDVMLAIGTHGQVTSDHIGAHTDLLAEFPYLGAPHPLTTT